MLVLLGACRKKDIVDIQYIEVNKTRMCASHHAPLSNVRLHARRWQGYMDVMPHIRGLQVSEALKLCPTIFWVVESRYGISYLIEPEIIHVRSHFAGTFIFLLSILQNSHKSHFQSNLTICDTFRPQMRFKIEWVPIEMTGFRWQTFAKNCKYDCNFRKLGRHYWLGHISQHSMG